MQRRHLPPRPHKVKNAPSPAANIVQPSCRMEAGARAAAGINTNRSRDAGIARGFLDLIAPGEKEFCFQLYGCATPWHHHNTLDNVFKNTSELVDIFVTINATDGLGRKAGNILRVRCLFIDLDGKPRKNINRLSLKPLCVVESSPGRFHAYWRTEDIDLDEFSWLQKRLAKLMGGDPSVASLQTCMRLPGTRHLKAWRKNPDIKDDFFLTNFEVVDNRAIDRAEFFKALKTAEKRYQITPPKKEKPEPHEKEQQPLHESTDLERVKSPLEALPNDDLAYDDYLHIGMALHWIDARELWDEWCAQSSKNNPATNDQIWKHFKHNPGGITIASLFYWARKAGWQEPIDAPDHEFRTNKFGIIKGVYNVQIAINKLGLTFRHDAFRLEDYVEGLNGCGPRVDDSVIIRIRALIDEKFGFQPTREDLVDTLHDLAREHTFHPVLIYHDGNVWDKTKRLDKVLITYFGAADTKINRAFGAKTFIAAVRRLRLPGSKFDNTLVLVGPQGIGKSPAVQIIAVKQDWYTDNLPIGSDSKITIEQMSGKWIAEYSELKGKNPKELDQIKAFCSRQVDRARLAWGRKRTEVPRQWIPIGTANETKFLVDDTGEKRWWPVTVKKINLEGLRRDIDQLWAEAASREAQGESTEIPENLMSDAVQAQEEHRVITEIEATLTHILGTTKPGAILADTIWHMLGIGIEGDDMEVKQRLGPKVGSIMRNRLGFSSPKKITIDYIGRKEQKRIYTRGPEPDPKIGWEPATNSVKAAEMFRDDGAAPEGQPRPEDKEKAQFSTVRPSPKPRRFGSRRHRGH